MRADAPPRGVGPPSSQAGRDPHCRRLPLLSRWSTVTGRMMMPVMRGQDGYAQGRRDAAELFGRLRDGHVPVPAPTALMGVGEVFLDVPAMIYERYYPTSVRYTQRSAVAFGSP